MALDTFARLLAAVPITIVRGDERIVYALIGWDVIAPMVRAFNRASTPEEKQRIINQIANAVQQHHHEQTRKTVGRGAPAARGKAQT